MDLSIQKLSKAYNRKPIFKDLTFTIPSGTRFAITGPNGSGKSTLLKLLSGGLLPTSGVISYQIEGQVIEEDDLYRHLHFVAPYNTVIEELRLPELFALHRRLGLLRAYTGYADWVQWLEYSFDPEKQIKSYSSGMKQRIKLGLALLDDRPLILLDEPGSNLDAAGKSWMFRLIEQTSQVKTVVIASNEPSEIDICTGQIRVG